MTAKTDIKAVAAAITPAARANSVKAGASMDGLTNIMKSKVDELLVIVNQVIAFHPNGDANLASLQAILTELS
jgi:hypothetical protein